MPYEHSQQAVDKALAAFEEVLCSAQLPYQLGQLLRYSDADELTIEREVARKLYEPQLPNAGDRERIWVKRLIALAQQQSWPGSARALLMAAEWQKMLPANPRHAGAYYIRHPLPGHAITFNEAGEKVNERRWVLAMLQSAKTSKLWDRVWFWQMVLDGLPEKVSDFEMVALFALRRWDGSVSRLVRLRNMIGEESSIRVISAEQLHAPKQYRHWGLSVGSFDWAGNEKALEKLHQDIAHALAYRTVEEVDACGWHPIRPPHNDGLEDAGLWFYDECAYADGKVIFPDADGIYSHNGVGFYLSERGRESEYLQGRPKLHPHVTVDELIKPPAEVQPAPTTDEELLRWFFREVCSRFYDTLGGFEGFVGLGAMFAYAAAPEIFAEYGFFPGLWIHGQMESGKTKVGEWLMATWGLKLTSGIGIIKATPVGLLQEAQNYSNLPIWLDEFRQYEVGTEKTSILRDAYNRQPPAKWSVTGIQRRMKTMYMVSGESTSTDAAVRSRYTHIQVSAQRRLKNHLEWFTAQKSNLFLFGRLLMERRTEFMKHVRFFLDQWLKNPATKKLNEREKMGHGIHWASWMAMVALLESHSPEETIAFKLFMLDHAGQAATDVTSESNINVFWTDLITAYKAGEIDSNCFKVESDYVDSDPSGPRTGIGGENLRWNSCRLFLEPDSVVAQLQIYLTKQRASVTLKRKDLRDQLSKNEYWISGDLRKRFGRSTSGGTTAWGICLDLHPLGFQPGVTDVQFQEFLKDREAGDPRQGPLYAIVHGVEAKQKQDEEAKQ